jgi:hypothetical protein
MAIVAEWRFRKSVPTEIRGLIKPALKAMELDFTRRDKIFGSKAGEFR